MVFLLLEEFMQLFKDIMVLLLEEFVQFIVDIPKGSIKADYNSDFCSLIITSSTR